MCAHCMVRQGSMTQSSSVSVAHRERQLDSPHNPLISRVASKRQPSMCTNHTVDTGTLPCFCSNQPPLLQPQPLRTKCLTQRVSLRTLRPSFWSLRLKTATFRSSLGLVSGSATCHPARGLALEGRVMLHPQTLPQLGRHGKTSVSRLSTCLGLISHVT